MPITEKTVELNVTSELLNFLYSVTGRTHVALAPSQQSEGKLGYDVGYFGFGWAALVQYKKATRRGTVWRWDLNRTKRRDQHAILQRLERSGIPVYYAFPMFTEPKEVLAKRLQLLKSVFWYKPGLIRPKGGATRHHHVLFDSASRSWSVHSDDEGDITPPGTFDEFVGSILDGDRPVVSLEDLSNTLNAILSEAPEASRQSDDESVFFGDDEDAWSFFDNQNLVVSPWE